MASNSGSGSILSPPTCPPAQAQSEHDYLLDQMRRASTDRERRMMLEKVQAEEQRIKKKAMYDDLLDSFKYGTDNYAYPTIAETQTLGQAIRQKIEEHKQMIAALEWFAAHISLDDPKDNTFVGRVVLEGLNALNERHRR